MSTDTIKNFDDQDAHTLACPACIEAATVVKERQEFVPEYALHKYSFEQLEDHLNSNKHSREQLIEVALRAAAFLYRHAFEKIEGV